MRLIEPSKQWGDLRRHTSADLNGVYNADDVDREQVHATQHEYSADLGNEGNSGKLSERRHTALGTLDFVSVSHLTIPS